MREPREARGGISRYMRIGAVRHALAIALLATAACALPAAKTAPSPAPLTLTASPTCTPTRADVPANYKADAPVRNKIGAGGYVIEGVVMRIDCTPVPEARIEFWHVNKDGIYDDDHRATVVADERGRYRLDTTRPVAYGGGPVHVHIRVSRPAKSLVAIHFPQGAPVDRVDLVFDD
jgi:protocatechuate 3,4-dioxygenase beta subunit